jgi:WD40 repeat protein
LTATQSVRQLVYRPDGKLLAGAIDDGDISIWDLAAGKVLKTLRGHAAAPNGYKTVYSVAFSPDGATLASGA